MEIKNNARTHEYERFRARKFRLPEDLNFPRFSNYPIRPVINHGESLIGYVYRCYSANGYMLPEILFKVLKILYFNNDQDALSGMQYLAEHFGRDFQPYGEQWLRVNRNIKVRELSWPAWDNKQVRICPECLDETGFYFDVWELPLLLACPKHLNGLLSTCNYCGEGFRWLKLLPDWYCPCRQPIKKMKPPRAKAGLAALARLLAQAYATSLPRDFIDQLSQIRDEWDDPEALYRILRYGCHLAGNLSEQKKISRQDDYAHCRITIFPLSTIGWAARLLCNQPDLVLKRLTRIFKTYFRHEAKLFEVVEKSDPFFRALLYLNELANPDLNGKFLQPFSLLIKKYRFFLPVNGLIIINPSLSKTEFKQHLCQFASWWAELAADMATLNNRLYLNEPESKYYYPVRFQIRKESDIYQILDELLHASYNNITIESYQALAHWWHIPDELRKLKPPSQALYQLGEYLKSIPVSELAFVHDLVLNGRGKAN